MEEKTKREEFKMAVVAMKQLLEAGVHFGHQTRRWDPKWLNIYFKLEMEFISSIYKRHQKKLDEAYAFVKEQAEEGKKQYYL